MQLCTYLDSPALVHSEHARPKRRAKPSPTSSPTAHFCSPMRALQPHATNPVRAERCDTGYSAAATRRPSSCSRLYVDAALRCRVAKVSVQNLSTQHPESPACEARLADGRERRDAGRRTESRTSTWIPRPLRYFLNAGGANMVDVPVPTRRISVRQRRRRQAQISSRERRVGASGIGKRHPTHLVAGSAPRRSASFPSSTRPSQSPSGSCLVPRSGATRPTGSTRRR